jgi:hypothetical protein
MLARGSGLVNEKVGAEKPVRYLQPLLMLALSLQLSFCG